MHGRVEKTMVQPAMAAAERQSRLAATGAVLGAILASSCCIIPLGLFLLGVGGSWMGTLTPLAPYQPLFVAPTLAILVYGFWHVHRQRRACARSAACARPLPERAVAVALWAAALLVTAALTFNRWGPWVLGIR